MSMYLFHVIIHIRLLMKMVVGEHSRWNERFRTKVTRKKTIKSVEKCYDAAKANGEVGEEWLKGCLPGY